MNSTVLLPPLEGKGIFFCQSLLFVLEVMV